MSTSPDESLLVDHLARLWAWPDHDAIEQLVRDDRVAAETCLSRLRQNLGLHRAEWIAQANARFGGERWFEVASEHGLRFGATA